jgi:hypothetical protein
MPPPHTPQHVIDAMQVVADHCRKVGYVGVYVADTGGASFYHDCPIKERGELLAEISRLIDVIGDIAPEKCILATLSCRARLARKEAYREMRNWPTPSEEQAEYEELRRRDEEAFAKWKEGSRR